MATSLNEGLAGRSRLARLAQATAGEAPAADAQCELCGQPIPAKHRHLLDLRGREIRCVCRACSLLFDHAAAGGGRYRLVPERLRHIEDFAMDEGQWTGLRIPVGLAFLFQSTAVGRVAAFYPSPLGATESLLTDETWLELTAANPVLGALEPDVEALLVNRVRGAWAYWLVPIDICYRLVGLLRTHWKGLGGGTEVWAEVERFFEDLERRARRVDRYGSPRQAGSEPLAERRWPWTGSSTTSRSGSRT